MQVASAIAHDEASRVNRVGNLIYDLEWIADKPALGWSATPETRLSNDSETAELVAGQGNGLTGFAVKFGLVGLFIFLAFFAYGTRRISGSLSTTLFGIVVVCVLLNGEQFLGFPLFLTLMFVPRIKSESLPILPVSIAQNPSITGR